MYCQEDHTENVYSRNIFKWLHSIMNAEECSVYVVSSVIPFLYKLHLYTNISIKNNTYKIHSKIILKW